MSRNDTILIICGMALVAITVMVLSGMERDKATALNNCPHSIVVTKMPSGEEIVCAPIDLVMPKAKQ